MAYSLTDLEVWKKARIFRNEISKLSKGLPNDEKYKLIDQIVRSSRSVSANIAEGHEELIKMLNGNINYLKKRKSEILVN